MLVVWFMGGFGNQMFQYAFYKKELLLGRNVGAELSFYDNDWASPFVLTEAFPNIKLNTENIQKEKEKIAEKHKNRSLFTKAFQKIFPQYSLYFKNKNGITYTKGAFCRKEGERYGYWQSEKYWKEIKDEITADFIFKNLDDSLADELADICRKQNTVSIHIRRGDYLEPDNQKIFGNICTDSYYSNAISYIKSKIKNPTFIIFTNDVEWAKENYDKNEFVFAADYLKNNIPDWYEMYLMTQCNHNIIANSSFSWWGAYLNKNKDKIVISPSKWFRECDSTDVFAEGWIRIKQ